MEQKFKEDLEQVSVSRRKPRRSRPARPHRRLRGAIRGEPQNSRIRTYGSCDLTPNRLRNARFQFYITILHKAGRLSTARWPWIMRRRARDHTCRSSLQADTPSLAFVSARKFDQSHNLIARAGKAELGIQEGLLGLRHPPAHRDILHTSGKLDARNRCGRTLAA